MGGRKDMMEMLEFAAYAGVNPMCETMPLSKVSVCVYVCACVCACVCVRVFVCVWDLLRGSELVLKHVHLTSDPSSSATWQLPC